MEREIVYLSPNLTSGTEINSTSELIRLLKVQIYNVYMIPNIPTAYEPYTPTLEELISEFSEIHIGKSSLVDNIKAIKKQIKHSKSPLEIKMLNKELNEIYKEIKKNIK